MIGRLLKFGEGGGGADAILNRNVSYCSYRLPACPEGGYVTDARSQLPVARSMAVLTSIGYQAQDGIIHPYYLRDNPPDLGW